MINQYSKQTLLTIEHINYLQDNLLTKEVTGKLKLPRTQYLIVIFCYISFNKYFSEYFLLINM